MKALIFREIHSFFSSTIGYLVIGMFLILNGSFLWLFSGPFNILDSGFADLTPYFELAPWVLMFLIPAVCMRSFSDEIKLGTLEILLTKPLRHTEIVLGKYVGAFFLILMALLPTLLYVFTIYRLGNPVGNLDSGSTLGSYLGLLFLIMTYTAIGVFASILTSNQIVAFIIAVFISLLLFYGFEGLSGNGSNLRDFGMKAHFESIARGILDTRDLIYFLCLTILFLGLTTFKLGKQ